MKFTVVGVHAVFRLPDDNFPHDPAGEVKGSKSRVDFLLHKVIPFAVEVHKPRAVLLKSRKLVSIPQRRW